MQVRTLTMNDFAPRLGKPFSVEAQNGAIQLLLVEAQELPGSIRDGGAFRLEFHGPRLPTLGQGTYRFLVGGQPVEIFIVPIGPAGEKLRYEAVFF
jgi:hypothetical protein